MDEPEAKDGFSDEEDYDEEGYIDVHATQEFKDAYWDLVDFQKDYEVIKNNEERLADEFEKVLTKITAIFENYNLAENFDHLKWKKGDHGYGEDDAKMRDKYKNRKKVLKVAKKDPTRLERYLRNRIVFLQDLLILKPENVQAQLDLTGGDDLDDESESDENDFVHAGDPTQQTSVLQRFRENGFETWNDIFSKQVPTTNNKGKPYTFCELWWTLSQVDNYSAMRSLLIPDADLEASRDAEIFNLSTLDRRELAKAIEELIFKPIRNDLGRTVHSANVFRLQFGDNYVPSASFQKQWEYYWNVYGGVMKNEQGGFLARPGSMGAQMRDRYPWMTYIDITAVPRWFIELMKATDLSTKGSALYFTKNDGVGFDTPISEILRTKAFGLDRKSNQPVEILEELMRFKNEGRLGTMDPDDPRTSQYIFDRAIETFNKRKAEQGLLLGKHYKKVQKSDWFDQANGQWRLKPLIYSYLEKVGKETVNPNYKLSSEVLKDVLSSKGFDQYMKGIQAVGGPAAPPVEVPKPPEDFYEPLFDGDLFTDFDNTQNPKWPTIKDPFIKEQWRQLYGTELAFNLFAQWKYSAVPETELTVTGWMREIAPVFARLIREKYPNMTAEQAKAVNKPFIQNLVHTYMPAQNKRYMRSGELKYFTKFFADFRKSNKLKKWTTKEYKNAFAEFKDAVITWPMEVSEPRSFTPIKEPAEQAAKYPDSLYHHIQTNKEYWEEVVDLVFAGEFFPMTTMYTGSFTTERESPPENPREGGQEEESEERDESESKDDEKRAELPDDLVNPNKIKASDYVKNQWQQLYGTDLAFELMQSPNIADRDQTTVRLMRDIYYDMVVNMIHEQGAMGNIYAIRTAKDIKKVLKKAGFDGAKAMLRFRNHRKSKPYFAKKLNNPALSKAKVTPWFKTLAFEEIDSQSEDFTLDGITNEAAWTAAIQRFNENGSPPVVTENTWKDALNRYKQPAQQPGPAAPAPAGDQKEEPEPEDPDPNPIVPEQDSDSDPESEDDGAHAMQPVPQHHPDPHAHVPPAPPAQGPGEYRWNPYINMHEPVPKFTVHFRRNVNGFIEEVHEPVFRYGYTDAHQARLNALGRSMDPFHGMPGTRASLGNDISLRSIPEITEVVVKRTVSKMAVRLLVEHIKQQHIEHPTRILVKRTRKGKFTYSTLVTRKQVGEMHVDSIVEKIWKLAKRQRKYLHLILKPNQQGGKIHDIMKNSFSLI